MLIGYIRVSTDMQADRGYGLDTQRREINKYCEEKNLQLLNIVSDEGISGTDITREGLTEVLTILDEVTHIVVLNTSRLWRDDTSKVLIKRELMKYKVDVISIEQPNYSIFNKDPNEFLVSAIMEALDQYDRLNINSKLAKGRYTKIRNGVKGSGNTPIGYKWHRSRDKSEVIIDADNAEIVKEVYKTYLQLGSLSKVKEYLDDKGYRTNQNIEFSTAGIHKILVNRFYIGEINWRGKQYPGKHEQIINPITFGKVQALLKRNKKG